MILSLPDTIQAHYEAIGAMDSIRHVDQSYDIISVIREAQTPLRNEWFTWTDVWLLTRESDATRWIQEA